MKTVVTENKKYSGIKKRNIDSYLGVPYAEPPVGDLRFKEPKKKNKDSNEVILCDNYPSNPIQKKKIATSEDCLYLNIWKPSDTSKKLPVMVWIYGGSYETGGIGKDGAGFGLTFDGTTLAKDTGCLIITINYRLNVFGFMDFTMFSDKFDSNIGLKDIVCGLEWIQDNIAQFGGDSQNVTVFGQSAGGALMAALSKIPSAQTLYHKMIVQSACMESFYTKEEAKNLTETYLKLLNISEDEVETILTLSSDKLISVFKQLEDSVREQVLGLTTFCPVIDGDFLLNFPYSGPYTENKPMIIGNTKDEGRMFTCFSESIANETGQRFFPYFTNQKRNAILSNYASFPNYEVNGQLITDIMYTVPCYWMATNYCKNNDVYIYRFNFFSGFFAKKKLNACHAVDVPVLFNVGWWLYFPRIVSYKKVGKELRQYWGNFARQGNPNRSGLVEWKTYNSNEKNVLDIGEETKLKRNMDEETIEIYKGDNSFFHQSRKKATT